MGNQKRAVKYIDMLSTCSPKTPEKEWNEEMMENLTLAPRKQYNSNLCLARFLHENTDFVRDEFFIFGYIFHKSVRTVTLYTSDAQKNLDDCVYIFACEDKTKLSDRSGECPV